MEVEIFFSEAFLEIFVYLVVIQNIFVILHRNCLMKAKALECK